MDNQQIDQMAEFFKLFDISKIILFAFSIFLLIGFVKFFSYIVDHLQRTFPARRLLFSQIDTIFSFFVYIFGINLLFFSIIQPPKELLLAAGGSIAVAIGLSLKDLVASIIAGIILLFDRPFQVGDRVKFEGNYGEIVSIGLRAVRLNTLDDNLVTIPNSKFVTEAVSCGNAGAIDMMVVVKFHFDCSADLGLAKARLKDIISTSRYVYLKKPIALTIAEEFHYGSPTMVLVGKCYVLDVKYEKAIETDIYTRAHRAFKDFPRPAILRESSHAPIENPLI